MFFHFRGGNSDPPMFVVENEADAVLTVGVVDAAPMPPYEMQAYHPPSPVVLQLVALQLIDAGHVGCEVA